jgi:small subunit ribosomal protein S1
MEAEAAGFGEAAPSSSFTSDSNPGGTLADDEALAALREKLSGR